MKKNSHNFFLRDKRLVKKKNTRTSFIFHFLISNSQLFQEIILRVFFNCKIIYIINEIIVLYQSYFTLFLSSTFSSPFSSQSPSIVQVFLNGLPMLSNGQLRSIQFETTRCDRLLRGEKGIKRREGGKKRVRISLHIESITPILSTIFFFPP